MPYGQYKATLLQRLIIAIVRKNFILRSAIRNRANRLLKIIRPGPIDHDLFGWKFRFFPFENTGDRKALLTPNGFDKSECNLISKYLCEIVFFLILVQILVFIASRSPQKEQMPRYYHLNQHPEFLKSYLLM